MATVTLKGTNGSYTFDPENKNNLLGKGGMGVVFKGMGKLIDPVTKETKTEPVAIKVLYREITANENNIERERRASAIKIEHDNLLKMLDFVQEFNIYHSISEYLDGETLSSIIKKRSAKGDNFTIDEAKKIILPVIDGIEVLHNQEPKLIHRDIDPSNIMICKDGKVKLMDYGIVKMQSNNSGESLPKFTSAGQMVGKPHYSAPEQIRNRDSDLIDESTDIYALGITLYEMITGDVPFDGSNEYDIMKQQMENQLPENPKIDKNTYALLVNATQKEKKFRYSTIAQFRNDLLKVPHMKVEPLKKSKFKLIYLLIPLIAIGLGLGGYFYYQKVQKEKAIAENCDPFVLEDLNVIPLDKEYEGTLKNLIKWLKDRRSFTGNVNTTGYVIPGDFLAREPFIVRLLIESNKLEYSQKYDLLFYASNLKEAQVNAIFEALKTDKLTELLRNKDYIANNKAYKYLYELHQMKNEYANAGWFGLLSNDIKGAEKLIRQDLKEASLNGKNALASKYNLALALMLQNQYLEAYRNYEAVLSKVDDSQEQQHYFKSSFDDISTFTRRKDVEFDRVFTNFILGMHYDYGSKFFPEMKNKAIRKFRCFVLSVDEKDSRYSFFVDYAKQKIGK